jgi:hypothetical protein
MGQSKGKVMGQIKSFSDLASLFDEVPDHVPGKWFLLPEREILTQRNRQFANKAGERPVVLARVAGPNAIVYPRSSSIGSGFKHKAHSHSATGCVINRNGYVPFDCPCTVRVVALAGQSFSCFEPEDSPLMFELQKVNAA